MEIEEKLQTRWRPDINMVRRSNTIQRGMPYLEWHKPDTFLLDDHFWVFLRLRVCLCVCKVLVMPPTPEWWSVKWKSSLPLSVTCFMADSINRLSLFRVACLLQAIWQERKGKSPSSLHLSSSSFKGMVWQDCTHTPFCSDLDEKIDTLLSVCCI